MKRNRYIVGLILLTFFVISFLTNIIGPLIPDILKSFQLNLTLVALLPFSFFIAYGVMSIPAGMMVERYREKAVMLIAFGVALIGALLLALVPDYHSAMPSLFLIGCGMAMLQVVINPLLRSAGGEEHFAFNSVLAQLIFGLASFVSPWVYSGMVTDLHQQSTPGLWLRILDAGLPQDLSWISLYRLFAVICVAMLVILLASRFPVVELTEEEKTGPIRSYAQLMGKRLVWLYFIGMICYVGTEQGISNWISQFLSTYHGINPQTTGAAEVSYFWGLMTAGGILGLVLLKLIDSKKVLLLFSCLALVTLTVALFGHTTWSMVAFPMLGFFASVMYPIIFSLALNSVSEHHGSFSGILLTGVIGGALIPLCIGWIGDHAGLRTGMLLLYLTLGYILSIGIWARPLIQNKTLDLQKKHEADA